MKEREDRKTRIRGVINKKIEKPWIKKIPPQAQIKQHDWSIPNYESNSISFFMLLRLEITQSFFKDVS